MAVEVENTSQVDEFKRVLKRRFWWIVVPAVLISVIGVTYAVVVPKKYVAKAQIMVYDRPGAGADIVGAVRNTAEGRVAGHKIKAPERIRTVLETVLWEEYDDLPTATDAFEYRKDLAENIEVETPVMERDAGQQVVIVKFAHTNAQQAKQFLEALLEDWKNEVLNNKERALKLTLEKQSEELTSLKKKREDLSNEIVELRETHRIAPMARLGPGIVGTGTGNPAFDKVRKLEQRIVDLEDSIDKAEIEIKKDERIHDRMLDTVPIDLPGLSDSTELELAENRLAEGQAYPGGGALGTGAYPIQNPRKEGRGGPGKGQSASRGEHYGSPHHHREAQ